VEILDDMRIDIAKAVNALKEQKQTLEALNIAMTKNETQNLSMLAKAACTAPILMALESLR